MLFYPVQFVFFKEIMLILTNMTKIDYQIVYLLSQLISNQPKCHNHESPTTRHYFLLICPINWITSSKKKTKQNMRIHFYCLNYF